MTYTADKHCKKISNVLLNGEETQAVAANVSAGWADVVVGHTREGRPLPYVVRRYGVVMTVVADDYRKELGVFRC